MPPSVAVNERAEALRRQTIDLLDTLARTASAFDLPSPPAALGTCRRKLVEHAYKVLVVGEAKRGKSTFVNALIGRPILPTAVDVATSQVFHVRRADKEVYRLRFEDDSQQEITLADLPRYGSQVTADVEGVPRLDQMIRWIEVDVPARFLPDGLSILDTPGLGALYAAHAQITHRFVPHADAVIFVLDSQAPMGEPEVRVVEEILKATRHIFFIQTRIDQFRKDVWQTVRARNQDILRERFAAQLGDALVWPISSTNLFKAATTGDADYLTVSRHKELEPALNAFLFRATGWGRAAQAVLAAEEFHQRSHSILKQRLNGLTEAVNAEQNRVDGVEQMNRRRQRLEADWGGEGGKQKALMTALGGTADDARRSFLRDLAPGGSIEVGLQEQIDALQSIQQAKQLAEAISAQVVEAAADRWRDAASRFRSVSIDLLEPFLQEANEVLGQSTASGAGVAVRTGRGIDLGNSGFQRTIEASKWLVAGAGAAWTAGGVLVFLIGTSWFPPLALAGVIGVGLWGAVQGWKYAGASHLQAAKEKLHDHLDDVLQRVRLHYLGEDGNSADGGLVGDYFRARLRELAGHVAELAEQKIDGLQREIDLQAGQSRLEGEQRKARTEELRRQLAEWDTIGESILPLQTELQELERAATL